MQKSLIASLVPAVLVHGALKLHLAPIPRLFHGIQVVGVLIVLDNELLWASSEAAAFHPFLADEVRGLQRGV